MIAGLPATPTPVPSTVAALAGAARVRAVWQNECGGITFELGTDPVARLRRRFVKWAPVGSGLDLAREAERLRWAGRFTPVPEVLELGADADSSWLLTAALPGDSAVSQRWKADPVTAVRAIGEGLRALHEALPVDGCPFGWMAEDRLADAWRRAGLGLIEPGAWHPEFRHLGLDRALAELADLPAVDRLVVCHGDSCAPNTLIGPDGRCTGHVDLGALGLADRWADLAVATWSTEWNYGPGWQDELLAAYGIAADPDRIRYYRLLWDLGP